MIGVWVGERFPILIPIWVPTAWGMGIKYVVYRDTCTKDMFGRTLLQNSTSNKSQRHRQTGTMKGCNNVTSPPLKPTITRRSLSFIFYLYLPLRLFLSFFFFFFCILVSSRKFNLLLELGIVRSSLQVVTSGMWRRVAS
jgi:hypothetical protein